MLNIEFLVDSIFLSALEYIIQCLLISMFSDEKSTVRLIENPLFRMSYFSLVDFKILSLSFDRLIMCPSVDLFKFILLGVHELLGCLD